MTLRGQACLRVWGGFGKARRAAARNGASTRSGVPQGMGWLLEASEKTASGAMTLRGGALLGVSNDGQMTWQ
jgi:hypothetical protein